MLIGLAGKSCTGKNLIGEIFESYGALHIDLDQINHSILEKEISGLAKLFGSSIINDKGCLNKSALSAIVFSDKKKLSLLEKFVHPLIDREVINIIKSEDPDKLILINGAVLHKSGLISHMDGLIFPQSLLVLRIIRAFNRDGFHPVKILKRFWNQRDIVPQLFSPNVDIYKVNNNRNRKYLERNLSELFQKWSK